MGASASKPGSGSGSASYVWNSPAAPGVSHGLVESLQSSPETDASRQQALELEIQARVRAELKRLQAQEAAALREAQEKLSSEPTSEQEGGQVSSHAVSKEVEALRAKLEERRKVRQLPAAVEQARGDVVRCLREHDRRPLDCWREVEAFKEEVRRLEKGWVDKVVS
ncbi:DUF1690-domain-containing protein [Bombardia bombarda]|uniref:DUF1690-domain-containing protein n=1 Tax=Bombardia bombarda TaxID=252184 RepID=A0AA39W502_9PEZI|nr:DUF1690-domain-containing protein [Bombardia bombarda]